MAPPQSCYRHLLLPATATCPRQWRLLPTAVASAETRGSTASLPPCSLDADTPCQAGISVTAVYYDVHDFRDKKNFTQYHDYNAEWNWLQALLL